MENTDKNIADNKKRSTRVALVMDVDYYINEKGQWVFTELHHRTRGYCCKNGCKHCPFGYLSR